MNNTAGRGVVLAVVAVVLGVIILGQGFDSPTSSVSAGETGSPTATPTDDGDAIEGDGTDATEGEGEGETDTDPGTEGETGTETDPGTEGETGTETDPGTEGETDTGTEDTGTTREPQEVRVLVANDTTVGGAASTVRDTLVSSRGYNGLSPTNTTTQGSGNPSVIYFAEGYRADARSIAEILGLDAGVVAPMPASPPVEELANAHVLVVIGPDLAGA